MKYSFIDFPNVLLTEKWHNRLGSRRNGFYNFVYKLLRKNNEDLRIIFSGDYVYLRQKMSRDDSDLVIIWNKDISKRDMYIHEFQDLYFGLCREKLKIIL